MAKDIVSHLFITESHKTLDYISPKGGGRDPNLPNRNRSKHGHFLKKQFKMLWEKAEKEKKEQKAVSLPFKDGFYIEFRGKLGFDLITKSLENIKNGIRLLNVREEEQDKKKVITATVYIPYNKANLFLKKIEDYLDKSSKSGKPKNKDLIESIEGMKLAVLESFWNNKNFFPKGNEIVNCEVWLRISEDSKVNQTGFEKGATLEDFSSYNKDLKLENHVLGLDRGSNKISIKKNKDKNINEQIDQFFKTCDELNKNQFSQNKINYNKDQKICFPERAVVCIQANKKQLMELIKSSDQIAEFRRIQETARFWLEQENKDQTEWVKDLQKRLVIDQESKISICLLDTGVNNGHVLVQPVLSDKDCHTVNPQWGVDDQSGHGTEMSGLIIYGDLQKALESKSKVNIHHKLESVKLIPKSGKHNKKALYGYFTKQGISRAEIANPKKKRTICMAITSVDDKHTGHPSSWSGALDQMTSGAEEENKKRLLIVSAGNVGGQTEWQNYPHSNLTNSIHDPAQSWNALTVGAYTDKAIINDPDLEDYKPVAKAGELSPFSTTSITWEGKKWPVKPDIVLEGGNVAVNQRHFMTESEDLSLLSLSHKPHKDQFSMIQATSASTAQASWMASQIQAQYPEIWPETVRALIVHSAEWKESMKKQFWNTQEQEKNNYKKMLRIFGYGVPNLNKALSSYKNSLTLITEQILQPFTKKTNSYSTKDMHFYNMPWPTEVLKNLPDKPKVKLKFTLSYFIEPGPGEIGWKDKYRYPSYGLRFALKKPQENEFLFQQRINKAVRDEEDMNITSNSDIRWKFGTQNRDLGSIHSDIWEGTAIDISECNFMAVYPTIGWWKTRSHLGKYNEKTRYSLVVSLSTPEEEVDIYTPVATKIGIPIAV